MPLDMFIAQFKYFTFSCFDTTLKRIEDVLSLEMDDDKYEILRQQSFKFDLYKDFPPKGGAHLNKAYFFVPILNKNIVIMMSNYSDGWQTLTNFISSKLEIKAYSFRITNIENSESFNSFTYFNKGCEIRTVYTMKDPKWVFYEQGTIQLFESTELYKQRIIKKRLDKNILVSYCDKIGFDVTNDKFWESNLSFLFKRMRW